MVFNSLHFAAFLPIVLVLYYGLGRHKPQNWLLLIASYYFYGSWDSRFLALMWFTTLVDYVVGRGLAAAPDDERRRRLFAVSIVVNLSVLGFFKYAGFFADSAAAFAMRLGFELDAPTLRILLPIGISFYTFHGISYTFDVYRRHIEPARDLLAFAVFVAYFPQLVAGPIGRAGVQLPQFTRSRERPGRDQVKSGFALILLGLFKKVAIADVVADVANRTFANPGSFSSPMLVVGAVAFGIQIYGDFSGYTDIARGTSRLFGVELLENFRQPYLSRSVTEFWRRWHISLSTWLRDYLYVPMGGNRGARGQTYRNLVLVMLIGGLWHGAAWSFVAWGGLHGAALAIERALGVRDRTDEPLRLRDIPALLTTLGIVVIGWVFFRAETIGEAFAFLERMFGIAGRRVSVDLVLIVVAAALSIAVIDLLQRRRGEGFLLTLRPAVQGWIVGILVLLVLGFSGGEPVQFIYFQF